MPDNHIITVPVNEQLQPETNESDLTKSFRAILANNASSGLDLKTLQKKEAEGKANLIASMSEIKTDVFTPFLLNEYSKTVNDVNDLDTKLHTLDNMIDELDVQIFECSEVEELNLLKLKKDELKLNRGVIRRERESKQDYMLNLHDQFAYKETFKDKGPKKDELPGGYAAMMAAIHGGLGASVANAATDKANAAIKEKAKSKKSKVPRNYSSTNPIIKTLFPKD